MAPAQRTKSGCWTCRLRRKKCSEGGPPCGTCEARQIFCHGYGRKPDWKDKGEKERQEAMRLQLESRGNETRDAVVPSDPPSASSPRLPSSSSSPSLPPTQPSAPEEALFNIDWSTELTSPFTNDFSFFSSSPGNNGDSNLEFQPVLFAGNSSNHTTLAGDAWPVWTASSSDSSGSNNHTQSELLSPVAGSSMSDLSFPVAPPDTLGRLNKEMDLIMQYISNFCSTNSSAGSPASSTSNGWLLFVLTRSPAFYNASLSISAYQQNHSSSQDDMLHAGLYHDYQEYRAHAARLFSVLKQCAICAFPGEELVCAVQLSRLEALAGNVQNCESYMLSAKSAMLGSESLDMGPPGPPDTPAGQRPLSPLSNILATKTTNKTPKLSLGSSMERKAIAVSQCSVILNDLLACSIQKKLSAVIETCRTWLSDTDLISVLRETTGCEPWVLNAILDCTVLEAWRNEQETRGALSIRALAGRADKIEAAIDDGIRLLALSDNPDNSGQSSRTSNGAAPATRHVPSHVHTSIFARAATIHLQIVVSGPKPGISEIGQSIDHAIEAWKAFSSLPGREWPLVWPLCTTASLATGAQRDFFRGLMAELSVKTMTSAARTASQCRTVVEKCWQEIDQQAPEGAPTCDWRDIFQRSGFCHLFS